mgnify:CR=1 FL=1
MRPFLFYCNRPIFSYTEFKHNYERKIMDIIFDRLPATAVTNEMYGMKLLTNNAVSLFNSWLKNKAVADFFEKYDALVKNSRLGVDRFNDLDLIVDTALLDKIAKENRHIRIYNPILEFVMFARRMSLDTNRMSS